MTLNSIKRTNDIKYKNFNFCQKISLTVHTRIKSYQIMRKFVKFRENSNKI